MFKVKEKISNNSRIENMNSNGSICELHASPLTPSTIFCMILKRKKNICSLIWSHREPHLGTTPWIYIWIMIGNVILDPHPLFPSCRPVITNTDPFINNFQFLFNHQCDCCLSISTYPSKSEHNHFPWSAVDKRRQETLASTIFWSLGQFF